MPWAGLLSSKELAALPTDVTESATTKTAEAPVGQAGCRSVKQGISIDAYTTGFVLAGDESGKVSDGE